MVMTIDYQSEPSRYRHWRLTCEGALARLTLDVAETGGLDPERRLKLNSYDLAVDIELNDAVQRLRFEHPEVRAVIIQSGKDRVFSAGANIQTLAASSHAAKVDFCRFTNETRLAIEDACQNSGQRYLAAVQGACAGGGYELALACDRILLVDDGSTAVSLPEVPLLAVLPGTGGLTRVTDKRRVRRDRADIFATLEEGVRGRRAADWRLVDEALPSSQFSARVAAAAEELAALSDRPAEGSGIALRAIEREVSEGVRRYSSLRLELERERGLARLTILGPKAAAPANREALLAQGDGFWPLRLARELEDAILHLRGNEPTIGMLVFASEGAPEAVLAHDRLLDDWADHWLVREIRLYWSRLLRRIDVTSRSLVALVEPGSCFAGLLAELVLACDRSFMALEPFEEDDRSAPVLTLASANFGRHPMGNGLSRLQARFWGEPEGLQRALDHRGRPLEGEEAEALGLVTAALDDIDWQDEIRLFLEERASFSPDALTGLEANLRFVGPETMESKIFARLSAWQNWIFQRPNATGSEGALARYGSGQKAAFGRERV